MHFFDVARRFYGGNAIVGGGLPIAVGLALADKLQHRPARHGVLLRRRRGGRGRVPRVAEPGGALEAAGALPLREQPLRDGHRRSRGTSRRPDIRAQGRGLRRPGRSRGRHGRAGGRSGHAPGGRARRGAATARSCWSCAPTASAPTRCTIPSCTGARRKSRSGSSAIRSRSSPRGCARRVSSTTPIWRAIEASVADEVDEAVAFAEAGPWEPVEDLTKDVYTPATP